MRRADFIGPLLVLTLALLLPLADAATARLRSQSGTVVSSCTIPSGGTCSFNFNFGCNEIGWYQADSNAGSYSGGGNVYRCDCVQGTTENGASCGNCGTQRRTCGATGRWGGWDCVSPGDCAPGAATCTGSSRYQCNGNCQWVKQEDCASLTSWTCTSATREYRTYSCSAGSCAYSVSSPEDCATKASTDTDSSATAYDIAGTVTDYTGCSGGTCASTTHADSCAANVLTEYGASAATIASQSFNCESREHLYCASGWQYRNEWGCAGGRCSDIADIAVGTNTDGDAQDKECGDSLCDTNPSYVDATKQCTPGQAAQCNAGRYQNCPNCAWASIGTNADGDLWDRQCGDQQCDNAPGISDTTKTPTETACTDGLDNDCDGSVDCADHDCDGSIAGVVRTSASQPLSEAKVSAFKASTQMGFAHTNSGGLYSFTISCATYGVIAEHADYAPQSKSNIVVAPRQQTTVNFNGSSGLILATTCEADCTWAGDEFIHAGCSGINGCAFFNSIAASACNLAKVGWSRSYNATHEVICPSGVPTPKTLVKANVQCAAGTLVKSSSIVLYNGKPVRLVVASCG